MNQLDFINEHEHTQFCPPIKSEKVKSIIGVTSEIITHNSFYYQEYTVKLTLELDILEQETLKNGGGITIDTITIIGYDQKSFLINNDGTVTFNAYYLGQANISEKQRKDWDTLGGIVGMTADNPHYGVFYYPSVNKIE